MIESKVCCHSRPQKIVWHGSDSFGKRNTNSYCEAWDTNLTTELGMSSSLHSNRLLAAEPFSCSNAFVLLCIENTARHDFRK